MQHPHANCECHFSSESTPPSVPCLLQIFPRRPPIHPILLDGVHLQPLVSDWFVWRFDEKRQLQRILSGSAYRSFLFSMSTMLGATELWRAAVLPKVKLFFWLVLHGRLWTADRRKRHHLQDPDICALCEQEASTTDHLLHLCVFSREVWCRVPSLVAKIPNDVVIDISRDLLFSLSRRRVRAHHLKRYWR